MPYTSDYIHSFAETVRYRVNSMVQHIRIDIVHGMHVVNFQRIMELMNSILLQPRIKLFKTFSELLHRRAEPSLR